MWRVRARRCLLLLGTLLTLAAAPAAHAAAAVTPGCPGTPSASGVPQLPGPALRLGINPAGPAGALGPAEPAAPDRPEQTLAALGRLRPGSAPFALRLNRLFWSDGEAAIRRFQVLANRYTHRNYLVELQVRYHPTPAQEGDVAGFTRFVREVVDRFGSNPRVVALQVTNEVNLNFSPDSSDGAYRGAQEALVQGVIAAKDEARRRRFGQLTIGFNWAYRSPNPSDDQAFWSYLRDRGGPQFLRALDWVGLDAYPGTFVPPVEPPGDERDGMVNALSSLRECWTPSAGIGRSVPIHVEETGYPTGPGRTEQRQVLATQALLGAVNDFRGTYNVSDLRWFDLRDHNSSSQNFQRHYGLLNDDYTPKPAFAVFGGLAQLSTRPSGRVRVAVRVRGRRATLSGRDLGLVRRVDWYLGRRLLARTDVSPFALRLPRGRATARLFARVALADGRLTGAHRSGRSG